MHDEIKIWGITTNNLKSIDITLDKKNITLIVGPSGSGKSSLAYDTIAQIGQYEYMSMFADNISEPTYRVAGFKGMVATVPIRQSNFNNNLRSTIATYFGLSRNIGFIYSAVLGVPEESFVLNRTENVCKNCHGLGTVQELDVNKTINFDIPLKRNPVRCWNRYKDFYAQIIEKFCIDVGINPNKTFRQLTPTERDEFLHGESSGKYSISYKKTNTKSRRTTKFYGILTGTPMLVNFAPSKQFFSDRECPCCQGKKFSAFSEAHRILNLSIGEFMTTPFSKLVSYVDRIKGTVKEQKVLSALAKIECFVKKANELNLGHLYFHRAIPTLSGGELQRLRMVQVLNAQISDLLVVLDEPLAGLSGNERSAIFDNILDLSKQHTVIVVDHSDVFYPYASKTYALGQAGGMHGGHLIDVEQYFLIQKSKMPFNVHQPKILIDIKLNSSIYKYKGIDISIGQGCLNLITGASGVGKSTLLREYLPQFFEHYAYISQKPLLGNKNSSVATALDIATPIADLFAKKHNRDRRFFVNQTGCDGACPTCGGAGFIEYDYGQNFRMTITCSDCHGTGFNKALQEIELNGKTIFDIWDMTLDEAIQFFSPINSKISKSLEDASSILLGHLKIGQPISTLSGGENIRIKLIKYNKSSVKVFGVDEPFKGLNNVEIFAVVQYLDHLRKTGKTIIAVDHTEAATPYFATRNHLIEEKNVLQFKPENQ